MEREELLIKMNIMRDVNTTSGSMKTPIPFVIRVVAQKNAKSRAVVELMFVERTKVRPASRTKHT